jgi:hypothetical protein
MSQLLELYKFIFSSFWIFAGSFLLLLTIAGNVSKIFSGIKTGIGKIILFFQGIKK